MFIVIVLNSAKHSRTLKKRNRKPTGKINVSKSKLRGCILREQHPNTTIGVQFTKTLTQVTYTGKSGIHQHFHHYQLRHHYKPKQCKCTHLSTTAYTNTSTNGTSRYKLLKQRRQGLSHTKNDLI
jgi:hypothetical protein